MKHNSYFQHRRDAMLKFLFELRINVAKGYVIYTLGVCLFLYAARETKIAAFRGLIM